MKIKINTTIILLAIVAVTAVLTWIVPAGQYEKVSQNGRQVLVEGSFHFIEASPQKFFDVLKAPMDAFGRSSTAGVIAFLLIIGGAFMVVEKTGAIASAIKATSALFLKHPSLKSLYIPVTTILFAIGGATFGMGEETLIFIPILIPLSLSLKYDSAIGVMMPFLGSIAGFTAGFMNPFSTGIAQGIAQLPLYSGFTFRLIIWIAATAVTIGFILFYAAKVAKNPECSLTYDFDKERRKELHMNQTAEEKFTLSHKIVLAAFALTMITLVFGVLKYEWYITEIGALFFGLGIVASVFGGIKMSEATEAFYNGVRGMAEIVFMLALATAIIVIAENGHILDTILFYMAGIISKLNSVIASWAAFLMEAVLKFFIPSSSGKAVLTMPILAPLADLIGLSRQTMILAYQFGDGWADVVIPTNAILLAAIGMAKIPYQKWVKFVIPLLAIWFIMSFAFLAIAVKINLQ